MRQYFRFTPLWVGISGLILGSLWVVFPFWATQNDARDEFGFHLSSSQSFRLVESLTRSQVIEIFEQNIYSRSRDPLPSQNLPLSFNAEKVVLVHPGYGTLKLNLAKSAEALSENLFSLCRYYGFDVSFVLSLIAVESRFRPDVVSPRGAIGLLQIKPETAWMVAKQLGLFGKLPALSPVEIRGQAWLKVLKDPTLNLVLSLAYLSGLRERYEGHSPYMMLAAYNMGPGRLDSLRQAARKSSKRFKSVSSIQYYKKIREGTQYFSGKVL